MFIFEKMTIYLWQGLAVKKKPPFFVGCASSTHEIVHSRDTGNNLKFFPVGTLCAICKYYNHCFNTNTNYM